MMKIPNVLRVEKVRMCVCVCCLCVCVCVCVCVCMCVCVCACIALHNIALLLTGRLCGTCSRGRGVTLDLQSCQEECAPGIIFFVIICKLIINCYTVMIF